MFDYQYGASTKKFTYKLINMLPRLQISSGGRTKALSLVFSYLTGFEVLAFSFVSKAWYAAAWDAGLWRELSMVISMSGGCEEVLQKVEVKIQEFLEKIEKKYGEVSQVTGTSLCLKWKAVYITLLYKYCKHCENEDAVRFLPILQRALCKKCAKLQEFMMISLENAENEYKVTSSDIERYEIEGLKVPHTHFTGKFMFVYYLQDILEIAAKKNPHRSQAVSVSVRSSIEERRRTEIVYYMKNLGISNEFIRDCLDNEGNLANSYVFGRSTMSADKIAKSINKVFKAEERKRKREMIELEEENNLKVKKKKIKLSEDEKFERKMKLIDRLTLMGIDTERVDFADETGMAWLFVNGKTCKDLGFVAGALWKEYKPVFTGLKGKTTQRIKDL